MIRNLQRLNPVQRRLVFILFIGGGVLLIGAAAVLLVLLSLNGVGRTEATAMSADVTVRQFAVLPDDDAYPGAVTVSPDGTVYTASYASGVVWKMDSEGTVSELPGTRTSIGAAAGLQAVADGSIYVVDQLDTDMSTGGGDVKRIAPDGSVSVFADGPDSRGFVVPYDVAVDDTGRVYVSDRGRNQVLRFDADGTNPTVWWAPPDASDGRIHAVTGLAYDPATQAIIVTDPEVNLIYRVTLADAQTTVIYDHNRRPDAPGFNGVTVTPDGTIYVAALGVNRIARVTSSGLQYLAEGFRGASDVAYAAPNRLYVTNFDQFSLAVTSVNPRLPFALDVIELGTPVATPD